MTKFDPRKPVVTTDGRKALIYEIKPNGNFSAFIEAEANPSKWRLLTYHFDGKFLRDIQCGDDLINITTKIKKEGWILIYPNKSKHRLGVICRQTGIYRTEAEAEEEACVLINAYGPKPIDIVKVEWKEEE